MENRVLVETTKTCIIQQEDIKFNNLLEKLRYKIINDEKENDELRIQLRKKVVEIEKLTSNQKLRAAEINRLAILQDKSRQELVAKEEIIQKLKKRLKNKSLSPSNEESFSDVKREVHVLEASTGIKSLLEQISNMRQKNTQLKTELENCKKELFQEKKDAGEIMTEYERLTQKLKENEKALSKLRRYFHEKTTICESSTDMELNMKLQDSYFALKDMSTEIVALRKSIRWREIEKEKLDKKLKRVKTIRQRETSNDNELYPIVEGEELAKSLIAKIMTDEAREMELKEEILYI